MNELVDTKEPREPTALGAAPVADRASRYVARMLQQHLVDDPGSRGWTVDGTAAFVDVSGFTALSEQLARKGREGAEQITEVIGRVFESMLAVAYESGGSLLKFGGDALLLWFDGEGHAARACRAAVLMRDVLDDVGRIDLPDAKVTLRMAQGVHSGRISLFRRRFLPPRVAGHRSGVDSPRPDAARRRGGRDRRQRRDGQRCFRANASAIRRNRAGS